MKILMIGTGYVGLVTGTCFAEMGHIVTCLDIDHQKVLNLQKGIVPIYEPGLEGLIKRNVAAHRLFFSNNYAESMQDKDVLFIAVPTPSDEAGACNMQYIDAVSLEIANHLSTYCLIINKSTAPVGTVDRIRQNIQQALDQQGKDISFDVASNPEFLKEGSAIADCMKPDRIIIGTDSTKAKLMLKEIYAPFIHNHDRMICMDITSSEMTKYAANAMLALRISFMNELSEICKKLCANIHYVRRGIGADQRIGYQFLYPGVGYGGSCFPKDVRALITQAKQCGIHPAILTATEQVNESQKTLMHRLLLEYFSTRGGLQGKTITIWGLAFKPDTDDIRESPAISLITALQKEGSLLQVYDPVAIENTKKTLPITDGITFCSTEFDACIGSDAICLMTEWKQFRLVDFDRIAYNMNHLALFDGRNQYIEQDLVKKGFDYIAIGIPEQYKCSI